MRDLTRHASRHLTRPHSANRAGFTLVELLVAILLLDVGVLAIVASIALISRRQVEMRARVTASQVAANRIQSLTVGPCLAATGSAADAGIVERWAAEPTETAPRFRTLGDSVVFAVHGSGRSVVVHARTPC